VAGFIGTSRASSTKTRIETIHVESHLRNLLDHQEQVPRKQGLKLPPPLILPAIDPSHQEQVPRKQGLKLHRLANSIAISSDIKSKFHENKD